MIDFRRAMSAYKARIDNLGIEPTKFEFEVNLVDYPTVTHHYELTSYETVNEVLKQVAEQHVFYWVNTQQMIYRDIMKVRIQYENKEYEVEVSVNKLTKYTCNAVKINPVKFVERF